MKNAISAMTDEHFRNAVDEKGNSLAHHVVTPRHPAKPRDFAEFGKPRTQTLPTLQWHRTDPMNTPNNTPSPDQPETPRILNLERIRRPDVPAAVQHEEHEMIGFQVVEKLWTQIRDIMTEMNLPEDTLRIALKQGHGIEIGPGLNPKLYFIVSQYQKEGMRRAGIENPTWFQLIGSSECWATSAEECERKYREMKA